MYIFNIYKRYSFNIFLIISITLLVKIRVRGVEYVTLKANRDINYLIVFKISISLSLYRY